MLLSMVIKSGVAKERGKGKHLLLLQ